MREYRFSLTRILPYNDKIEDFCPCARKYGRWKPVFMHILCSLSVSEKIKAINNKIEQNKNQFDSDSQTGKIWASSSGNVSKYQFLTDKDVLPETDLLEKAATIERFEYAPLGK